MTGARYFAKQRERQRDAQIAAMQPAFNDTVGGALVSMPVVPVTAGVRVRAYVSSVVRRGTYGGRVLRVTVRNGDELRVMTRSARGWEFG